MLTRLSLKRAGEDAAGTVIEVSFGATYVDGAASITRTACVAGAVSITRTACVADAASITGRRASPARCPWRRASCGKRVRLRSAHRSNDGCCLGKSRLCRDHDWIIVLL